MLYCNAQLKEDQLACAREKRTKKCCGILKNVHGKNKNYARGMVLRKRRLECNRCGNRISTYELRADVLCDIIGAIDSTLDVLRGVMSENKKIAIINQVNKENTDESKN